MTPTPTATAAERHQLGVCAHEAAHAIFGVLAGARIAQAEVIRGGPRTNPGGIAGCVRYGRQDDSLAAVVATQRHRVVAAGSVAEAVFHHGPRPTGRQIDAYLDVNTRDRAELLTLSCARGGEPPRPREVLSQVRQVWPAIAEVARTLWLEGSATHADVLGALGISPQASECEASIQLASIRNGYRPNPLRLQEELTT